MNATLMGLRTAEPSFQVQVIARMRSQFGAREQAWAKRRHHLGKVRVNLVVGPTVELVDLRGKPRPAFRQWEGWPTRPQTTSFGCSEATRSALSGPDCAAWEIPSTRSSRRKGKSCAARKVCGRVDTTSRSTYPTDSSPMIDAMTMPTMTRRIRPAHCSFQEQSAQPEPAPRSAAPSRPTLVWRDVQIVAGLLLSLFCGTLASDLLIQFWAR